MPSLFSEDLPSGYPTRESLLELTRQLWEAEKNRELREGGATLPQANYSSQGMALEAWSRLLWALIPATLGFMANQQDLPQWLREALEDAVLRLRKGCDPHDPAYFQEANDKDQRFVEMAVLGLALHLLPGIFLHPCSPHEKKQIHAWFSQIHLRQLPRNNWHFFRCFVSLGMLSLEQSLPEKGWRDSIDWEKGLNEDLALLESFYMEDGWYKDGDAGKRDYYNPFGFHTYALLLHGLRPDLPVLERFRQRVAAHLETYARLFDTQGRAIAFGRSMTYRFAQGSLLTACICHDLTHEADPDLPAWFTRPWLKTLLFRHLRYWFSLPIFTEDGRLSVGYAYPNSHMAEEYNAYGSPAWGLKTFWILALPDDHPFWQTELLPDLRDPPDGMRKEKALPGILVRAEDGEHAFLLNGGQLTGDPLTQWVPRHAEDKYAKFVYSSLFGFGVSTTEDADGTALDSTLAVSLDGEHWQTRAFCENPRIEGSGVSSTWRPFGNSDLIIHTRLLPLGSGHLRIHTLHSTLSCWISDGGFACPENSQPPKTGVPPIERSENRLALRSGNLCSLVQIVKHEGACASSSLEVASLPPSTHLLFPHAQVPTVKVFIHPGESKLTHAVYGGHHPGQFVFNHG